MDDVAFEHASEVRDALRAIATDPALGPESLDNVRTAANLLGDLLPDAPRETGLLLAAINAGTPAAASPSGNCIHSPVLSPVSVVEAYIAAINQSPS